MAASKVALPTYGELCNLVRRLAAGVPALREGYFPGYEPAIFAELEAMAALVPDPPVTVRPASVMVPEGGGRFHTKPAPAPWEQPCE